MGTRRVVVGIGVAVGLLVVLIVTAGTSAGPLERLDLDLADTLNRYVVRHRAQVTYWKHLSDVGGPVTWRVLAVIAAVWLALRRRLSDAVVVLVATGGAWLTSGLVKSWVGRDRPSVPTPIEHAPGGSFPSGHALASATAMILLVVVAAPLTGRAGRRAVLALAVAITVLVGFSRLILGVHYLSDVLGGWIFALLWVGGVRYVVSRLPDVGGGSSSPSSS